MIIHQDQQLTVFQSGLYQTNTTLYHSDHFLLLVDPNWLPSEIYWIRNYIQEQHRGKKLYLLFTHSDYDHIVGYGLFPEAKVIASEKFYQHPDKEQALEDIRAFDQKHYIHRDYPLSYPEVDFIISQDGQQLEIEGERFTFYLSPGHTSDGLFTIIEKPGIFIAGDYLSNLEFPFIYYDSRAYDETLMKVDGILQQHMIQHLVPGHGSIVSNDLKIILERKETDLHYIKALRQSIRTGTPFPLEDWLGLYPFPDGLKEEHAKNEQHVRNELSV